MANATLHRQLTDVSFIPSIELESRSAQLSSLLVLLYGNGSESFNALHQSDRDNILWLASDLACEINDMIKKG